MKTFEDVRTSIRAFCAVYPGGYSRGLRPSSINDDPARAEATLPPLGEAAPPDAEMIAKLLAGHAERGLRTCAVRPIEVSASASPADIVGRD